MEIAVTLIGQGVLFTVPTLKSFLFTGTITVFLHVRFYWVF